MKLSPSVKKETGHIALGVLIGSAVMVLVFWLLKRLDVTVLLGAVLGSAAAVGNFLVMGIDCQRAMEDPDRAKRIVQQSYTKRMLAMVVVMILGFVVPFLHPVAVLIPFLLPGITIRVMQLLGLTAPEKEGGGKT